MLQHKPRHLGPGALRVGKIGRVKHHFKINQDGARKMGGSVTRNRAFQMQLTSGGMALFGVVKNIPLLGHEVVESPHADPIRESICKQTRVGNPFGTSK